MNAAPNTNEPSREDVLTRELLLLAVGREIEPPRDVLDRVRVKLHENTVRSPSAAPQPATHRIGRTLGVGSRRAWFAGAGAAAVVVVALFFLLQPSTVAWSQVVQTVRAMPWIHAKAVGRDGTSQESWASFSRNIGAVRAGDMIRYDDFRSGIRYEYDSQQKKLFRLSTSGEEQFKSEEEIFRAIFRGEATLGESFPGHPIVQQRQRTVDEQGRRWILYELEFGEPGGNDSGKKASVVIRVDPQRMLPDSMTFTRGDEKSQMTIDYPDDGPADIYALGVPRDAPVDDRMPPPDLDRILKIVEQNRRDFGDYLAVAGGDNSYRRCAVHLIRCKADKCRVDVGLGDTRHVASGADMERWWQDHGREVMPEGLVLCDGQRVYQRSFVGPKPEWKLSESRIQQGDGRAAAARSGTWGDYFVDLQAYPPELSPEELASTPQLTVHLDPTGEKGPAGSVRVERLFAELGGPADRNMYHRYEFWLQPAYGYAVVKYAISDCPAVDEAPLLKEERRIWVYEGFRQTPSGVWYPTVVRREHTNPSGDRISYFYLDFAAKLPDALFSPKWEGDLLSGVDFAQPDDKLTSNDLGKIRPPGGVPLIFSRSVLTPEVMCRVSRRLEIAPEKDLDKWVAELERISGEKLNSWTEKQACRTAFVTRMGVAFDGLRWNAKTADVLFQRAQSLPSAESRAWKGAFETLLNEKVEPAYAVPLVLVPVDVLHEGQMYSAARAGKYLARLKQLTAGDVALWKDKADEFGGRNLDAAMNIILLGDFFEKEEFQRDKFRAAIDGRRGRSQGAQAVGSK